MMLTQNITLLSPEDTLLLVIDVQEKLLPAVFSAEKLLWNTKRLIEGAKIFGLPILVTEQYPQGLGQTVQEIKSLLPEKVTFFEKKSFSACLIPNFVEKIIQNENIRNILICGMETHVCVLQTALDLLAAGLQVHLAADAVSSRFETDYDISLRRMETSGAFVTTTEASLFELCRTAESPYFKSVSKIVREKFVS
ncbi:MAG: hydrolase [Planctomycetaceae bacterium]|nr:hydrolase [Planctomycetaceae bacterium]